jgi:DNA-binding XRE family transcriptional regulator
MIELTNLASINPFALPFATIAAKKQMPKISGIYFVVKGKDQILYIGKTINLRSRWESHHRLTQFRNIDDVRISWLEISDGSLLGTIEDVLINYFSPVYNRAKSLKQESKNSKYGKVITNLRSKVGLTQKEVADRLGVTVQTISNWETNTRAPLLDPKKTWELCNILQCSLKELIEEIQ